METSFSLFFNGLCCAKRLVNSSNRYGIPAFPELHVWAWRDHPNGAFVD